MKVYFIIVAYLVCGGSLIHLDDFVSLFVQSLLMQTKMEYIEVTQQQRS